jgi:hypothetical protein
MTNMAKRTKKAEVVVVDEAVAVEQVAPPAATEAPTLSAVDRAVAAARKAEAEGTLKASAAGKNAELPPGDTPLVTRLPRRRLTGQAHGGTARCYEACRDLELTGELTIATALDACKKLGNPEWVKYAYGRWLLRVDQ